MKLSLQGHTIVIASGDYGVAAPPGDSSPSGCLSGFGQNQTIFNAPYPNGCPWTTSVGGTQLSANATVYDPETGLDSNLGDDEFTTSTGGFSNYFVRRKLRERLRLVG
jgi:tripeptidyl-peptidase I